MTSFDMTNIDTVDILDHNGERDRRESDNQKGERQKKRSLYGSELR